MIVTTAAAIAIVVVHIEPFLRVGGQVNPFVLKKGVP
jgi:hypothetical protein